jgi:hypothetical protein
MSVEDYEIILSDGWEAFLAYFIPKVHNLELLERHDKWMAENLADMPRRYHERGYATLASVAATIPFEALCVRSRSFGRSREALARARVGPRARHSGRCPRAWRC